MQNSTLAGVAIALGSGLAIGIQTTLFTLIGRSIGPFRASLAINVAGGILAGLIVTGMIAIQGREQWNIPRGTVLQVVVAVSLGILILTGVTFAFQRAGIAAGTATVFLGQMVIGVAVDALGLSGSAPIPLDARRVLGLLVMAAAVFLLTRQS